jgi:hypothetical protein
VAGSTATYFWQPGAGAYNQAGAYGLAIYSNPGSQPYGTARYRYYRSAEGYTYQRPAAVLKAQPNGPYGLPARAYSIGDTTTAFNYVGIVLKRTATASIELRYNGDGQSQPNYPGPDVAKDMEIWIDLASGSAVKVADFDIPYGTLGIDANAQSPNGAYGTATGFPWISTLVGADTHLVGRIDSSNKIIFQLWIGYPGPGSTLIGEIIYQMTAPQITELGIGVAGQVGIIQGAANTNWPGTLTGPPTVYYFEARKDDVPAVNQNILVMGNIDVPYVMDLRGDVVNPVVTITNPDGEQHFARLLDTIQEANPVTINSREGTITDQNGLSRFGGFQPGSEMGYLKPGINNVQLDALTWGTGPHAYMRWRDARR